MHYLKAKYSRDLYLPELQMLMENGDPVDVRGRTTIELLNFISEVEEPWHHCILIPSRRWNPWLALSEALWILAGRDDVAALLPYNSHIVDYSDDGVSLYGAYGRRIFHQIDPLIERLRKDPSDRRAVLSIWYGTKTLNGSNQTGWRLASDLEANTKDPPCLSGDTIILSPEGDLPIKELVGKHYPIYTYKDGEKRLAWAVGSYSGKRAVLKITLNDGSILKATPDHLFRRTGTSGSAGEWIKAESLTIGMGLYPINFSLGDKGHWLYKTHGSLRTVHKAYYTLVHGLVPQGFQVHHSNHNPADNRISNLMAIPTGDHFTHHNSKPDGRTYRELIRNTRKTTWSREQLIEMGRAVLLKYGKLSWHQFNNEYKGIVSGVTCQVRWGKWSNYVSEVIGNHKVVKLETIEEEDVYDLTVEGSDCFFVAPGILVHNCNNMVYFKLRDNKLHMTVINRSNDIHFGLFAVNLPTFGILQAYIAARLGVDMGTQTHLSNSLHVYTDDQRAVEITNRMLGNEPEDMPAYPKHEKVFEDLTNLGGGHNNFASWCSMVLDNKVLGNCPWPFLVFAQDFLKQYREHIWDPTRIKYSELFMDWCLAGKLFTDRVWREQRSRT